MTYEKFGLKNLKGYTKLPVPGIMTYYDDILGESVCVYLGKYDVLFAYMTFENGKGWSAKNVELFNGRVDECWDDYCDEDLIAFANKYRPSKTKIKQTNTVIKCREASK